MQPTHLGLPPPSISLLRDFFLLEELHDEELHAEEP
jgi:hypothetical protein